MAAMVFSELAYRLVGGLQLDRTRMEFPLGRDVDVAATSAGMIQPRGSLGDWVGHCAIVRLEKGTFFAEPPAFADCTRPFRGVRGSR